MKVLLIGAANSVHILRWTNALVERGCMVHLASQHDPLPGFDRAVELHRMPHISGAGYYFNRLQLRRLIKRIRPSVINAHYASGYGTLAVSVPGVPLVLNVWGSDVYEFPEKGILQRGLLKRNLRRADQIVSTSKAMALRTEEVCPALGPITVVPFGVDIQRFQPLELAHDADVPLVVGTVKTIAPNYGIDTLVNAFARLRGRNNRGRAVRLRIVGAGPGTTGIRKLIDSLGIATQVDLVGAVPHAEVPGELQKLDVYLALSRAESFGVAVIEASACGLPVIVSDVGGLPEVVEDGVTGYVVPKDDPETAAHRLAELLANTELRRSMGEAGRLKVQNEYSWSTCVDRMLEVYRTAVDKKKA